MNWIAEWRGGRIAAAPTAPWNSMIVIKSGTCRFRSVVGRVRHPEEAVPPAFSREDLLTARLRVTRVLPYQRSAKPFISNLSLSIFSGLLLVFAFPEWNLWSLGWVGTAPLIMAVMREQRFWRSLLYGLTAGTIFYTGSSYWVTYSMHNYGGIPLWLSYVLVAVLAAILASFTGLFAGVLALVIKHIGGWGLLIAPVIWVASEFARMEVTGVGWNPLGCSQAFQPAVIQISRWGGVYAVSALLVSASTAVVFALVYLERLRGLVVLTVAGVITVLVILYGQAVLKEDLLEGSEVIAVVQPNIPIEAPWHDRTFVDQMIQRHLSLSEEALLKNKDGAANDADRAAIVIWPESHMNFDYERDPALQQTLREFTARNKVTLLLNSWAYSTQWSNAEAVHNSAIAIGPSGDRIYRYDKIALVPFGEYVPARGLIPLMDRIPALVADVTPGQDLSLGLFGPVHLGVAICFETIRPDIARQMRTQGASALVQISNEAWFGPTAAPRQMLSHAVFRAVENNIVLIRATNSGLSARISSHGVVSGETQTFETATRRWRIPSVDEAPPMTFYSRSGDLFAGGLSVLSILVALACAAAEFWKRKKSDND